jgi:hypothetical protein
MFRLYFSNIIYCEFLTFKPPFVKFQQIKKERIKTKIKNDFMDTKLTQNCYLILKKHDIVKKKFDKNDFL